jgi:hypothetical protein
MFNYSFWADEAYISGIAAQWITRNLSFFTVLHTPGITYQRLHMLIVGAFFNVFGLSEFAARLPSILFFGVGIIGIYFLAKKLSNTYGGVLSSFIYLFSHLNLAYATQAKPYTAIETITILVILLMVAVSEVKNMRQIIFYHSLIVILLCLAALLHTIGGLLWIIYFVFLIVQLPFLYYFLQKIQTVHLILSLAILGFTVFYTLPIILKGLLPYNHWYQAMKLFGYKYSLLLISAVFGYIWNYSSRKSLTVGIAVYLFILMFLWNFYAFPNIRYLLSIFGVIFLYFGVFWAKVGEKYDNKIKIRISKFKLTGKVFIPVTVMIIIYATGYKIVRAPQAYYNPNIDKYGDVQIANYKDFYVLLKQRFPNYKDVYVVNDVFDVEYWYFGRYSNAYFLKGVTTPYPHQVVKHVQIYGSVNDFKNIISNHRQGLLIMEDWESLLPDDVKEYAKKNLHLEFRVESLREAPNDPWPLALYSWGFDKNSK